MATMIIEYNGRSKTTQRLIEGLLSSGIIRRKQSAREQKRAEFREALREAEAMAADIRKNGTAGYKTLDELLNEDD
jgi:predicted transcriptional regulator